MRRDAWKWAWVLLVLMTDAAAAHAPYLDQLGLKVWVAPDGRRFQLGMLFGDGIFGPDPGRAVVLDDHAKIVAVGPPADDGYTVCYTEQNCFVLLSRFPFSRAVPDPTSFRAPRSIEFYPEFEKETYGFSHYWLGPRDYFTALTVPLRRDAVSASVATLALTLLAFSFASASRWADRFGAKQPQRSWKRLLVLLCFLSAGFALLVFALSMLMLLNGFYLAYAVLSPLLLYKLTAAANRWRRKIAA